MCAKLFGELVVIRVGVHAVGATVCRVVAGSAVGAALLDAIQE